MRQLTNTASVFASHLRRAIGLLVTFLGPSWDGPKITICAVPDRNGARRTFSIAHRPGAGESRNDRLPGFCAITA